MLDQLDDPVPFTVSPDLVAAAKSRGTHLRRRHHDGVHHFDPLDDRRIGTGGHPRVRFAGADRRGGA